MRALFSIVSVLVVLFIVLKLAGRQAEALLPAAAPGGTAATAGRTAAEQAAGRVRRAMEQGAAARASEAAGQ